MSTYLKGVGMSRFDVSERNSFERICEAVHEALGMSDMSIEDVEAVFIANSEAEGNGERQRHTAPFFSSLFQVQKPILTTLAGCGSGGAALYNAIKYQRSTGKKNILVLGYEKLVASTSPNITDEMFKGGERIYEQTEGMIFPAQNALVAQQYMLKYDATIEDLSKVALKNHEHAYLNPKAMFYSKKVTLDMIQKSPVVASPLRLFDCSIPVNGGAACIISTDKTDIEIVASSLQTCNLTSFEREDMTSWDATKVAAKKSYEEAHLAPKDIDFLEIHDAFTPVELISYEDLGFAKKGEGAQLIRKDETTLNGSLPVNTSGGLKAKGHPISATGVSQIYEIAQQMRKSVGQRQLDKTDIGMAHNIGGAGCTASVHIFKAC